MSNWYAHNLVYAEGWQAADLTSSGSGSKALFAQVTIASLPVVQDAKLQQEYAFSGQAVASKAPQVVVTGLREENALAFVSIVAEETVVGFPVLLQGQALTSNEVITRVPEIEVSLLDQRQAIASTLLLSGAPIVEAPTTAITAPVFTEDLLAPFVVQTAEITQLHSFDPTNVASSTSLLVGPNLSLVTAILLEPVSTGLPAILSTVMTQTDNLTPDNTATALGIIEHPMLYQEHVADPINVVILPISVLPAIQQAHEISSQNLSTQASWVDTVFASQVTALTVLNTEVEASFVGSPVLTAEAVITTLPLEFKPYISFSALRQYHALEQDNLLSGTPVIDEGKLVRDTRFAFPGTNRNSVVFTSTSNKVVLRSQ